MQSLRGLTRPRLESLAAWVFPTAAASSRRLVWLKHIQFAPGFVWHRHPYTLEVLFVRMYQFGLFPALESVDLSETNMSDRTFEAVLDGLAATTRLRVLLFPSTCWSQDVEDALGQLLHPRKVGCRHPPDDDEGSTLAGMNAVLKVKEFFPQWGTGIHTLDFSSSCGDEEEHAGAPDNLQDQPPGAGTFPRLRVMRFSVPIVPQLFWDELHTGALQGLEELVIQNHMPLATFDAIAAVASTLRSVPAGVFSKLRVLRVCELGGS